MLHQEMNARCGCAGFCVVVHNFREEPPAAVGLLTQGPEALQSQFESGYGMALNLLFSRSLDQAQDFISRSFSSYLSACPPPRSLAHALVHALCISMPAWPPT